jgi:hypothetical protein
MKQKKSSTVVNQFLDSLSKRMSENQLFKKVTRAPDFSKKIIGQLTRYDRRTLANELLINYRFPSDFLQHTYNKIYDVLSLSYKSRPPEMLVRNVNKIIEWNGKKGKREFWEPISKSSTPGFSIFGISGLGKSTVVDDVLSLFPKVVFHPDLQTYQIPCIKVSCPPKASTKGLCKLILRAVDEHLGRENPNSYANRTTEIDLLMVVADVCQYNAIGAIFIDEIHNLRVASEESKERVLDFLKILTTMAGVPIIYIGNPRALEVLCANHEIARRSKGIGWLVADRFQFDTDAWDNIINSVWNLQVLRRPGRLTRELSFAYYDETQGILGHLVVLHMNCQLWALDRKKETISVDLVREVSKFEMGTIRPMMAALRSGDPTWIARYPDIDSSSLTQYFVDGEYAIAPNEPIKGGTKVKTVQEKKSQPKKFHHRNGKTNLSGKPKTKAVTGELVDIAKTSETSTKNAYDILKTRGFIPDLISFCKL